MSGLPQTSIDLVQEVRVCDEHRCRILRKSEIWKRFNRGELRFRQPYTRPRKNLSGGGIVAPWTQEISLVDDAYSSSSGRYIVLEAHCYRLYSGRVGASGLVDPKEVLVGDILYVRLNPDNRRCTLCEGGDMVPYEMRFPRSTYKPPTPPLSFPNLTWLRFLKSWNRYRDLWAQRKFVWHTKPPAGMKRPK
jgi:hypothetical protein